MDKEDMEFFNKAYLRDPNDALDPRFSPILVNDLSNLPPALIITSEYDPLRDSAETYVVRLTEADVSTVVVRFNGVIHSFYNLSIQHTRVAIGLIGSVLKQAFYSKH